MRALQTMLACGLLLSLSGCIRIAPAIPSWPTSSQEQLTLSAADGFVIAAQINGHPVRLRVDPGYSGVILNPDVAARIGLVRSMWENDLMVGPVRVQGETGVAPLVIGSARDERRIIWFEKDITSGADGIINIASLPYDTVTLQLRPSRSDETTIELQTNPDRFWSLVYNHRAADRHIDVRFSLNVPRTVLTAAAGAHLASHHGGTWAGEAFEHVIGFDVSRPVRPMAFSRPVALDHLNLDRALVRTADFRGRHALPTDAPDPNEIIVTGPGQRSRALFTAMVGVDHLSACSSISYTGRTRMLTLRCRN